MTQVDTFGEYVRLRLEEWGEEFALHRDCEYLGHQSKNIVKVLMEHRGMPSRATGFKPLEINPAAQEIEDIVAELGRSDLVCATVMRAYYCGIGKRTTDRFDQAIELLVKSKERPISIRQYHYLRQAGDTFVRCELLALKRAA